MRCSYAGCINMYNGCIFFLDRSFDNYVLSLSLVIVFILKSILSDRRISTPAFLWFPLVWNTFFHSLTFSLYVSLGLKWVSCRQHIYGSCFCIQPASLCVLVGAFNPFTFKFIMDMYVPIILGSRIWLILLNVLCALEQNMYLAHVGWGVL